MVEIYLEESHTARYGDVKVTKQKKSPIPVLLRKLVNDGVCSESDDVVIKRGEIVCFKPINVGYWTAIDIRDDDKVGLIKTKYRPFEGFD